MKVLRLALTVLLIGISSSHAAVAFDEAARAVAFADSLVLQHRYREAELEYERFASTHPDYPGRPQVLSKMFDAAMATKDNAFTLTLARTWEAALTDRAACLPFQYEQRALYRMGNYPAVIRQTPPAACEADVLNENRYLHGLSRLRLSQWPEARQAFDHIPAGAALHEKAAAASAQSADGPNIPRKSPGLAAGLNAVLPGAGYAYARRPQTAAACLVVNGLSIWGTVAAVHAGEPGLAALLALFSFTWYWGGVYGSAQAAQKETQSQLSAFIEPLELAH